MSWWGKVLGGAFGFLLGGPLGALLGAALGHNLDRGLAGLTGEGPTDFDPGSQERVQTAFFTAAFSVMGHLAKVDGRVSQREIALAERIMARMALAPELRQTAMRLFSEGKRRDFPLDDVLYQFRRECHGRQTLIRVFIEIQLQAAFADGALHASEDDLLLHICDALGFPYTELERLKAMAGAEQHYGAAGAIRPDQSLRLEDAYAILAVDPEASDAEVKKAYRRLMGQHHPDKLVAKGLPEEMMQLAKEKTQEIRAAYDRVRETRGF